MRKIPYYPSFLTNQTYLSIDHAMEFVGDNSNYQKRIIAIFAIQFFLFSWLQMGLPVLFQDPIFECLQEDGLYEKCSEYQACQQIYKIDEKNSYNSIALEFGLYCDKKYVVTLAYSNFFFAVCFSSLLFSYISDVKGRQKGLIAAGFFAGIAILIMCFTTHVSIIIMLLSMAALGLCGLEVIIWVYVTELTSEKYNNLGLVIFTISYAVAQVFYSAITSYLSGWRQICLWLLFPYTVFTTYLVYYFVYESPRYLVKKLKFKEAKVSLNKISKVNRRPQFNYKIDDEIEKDLMLDVVQKNSYTYVHLFKVKKLRIITLQLAYMWFYRYLTYFGLNFSMQSFGGDFQSNATFLGISEIIACVIGVPLIMNYPRRDAQFFSIFSCTISCILTVFFPMPQSCYQNNGKCYQRYVNLLLAINVKFQITIFNNLLVGYTQELYPASVRSIGFAFNLWFGKLATFFMPWLILVLQKYYINPLFFFGIMGITASYLSRIMPETGGSLSQDLVEDYIQEEQSQEEMNQIINQQSQKQSLIQNNNQQQQEIILQQNKYQDSLSNQELQIINNQNILKQQT